MATFHEETADKRIEELRKKEEEELARILSGKYGLRYIDLTRTSINNDALSLVDEGEAREALLAPFDRTGKKVLIAVKSPNKDETKRVLAKLDDRGFSVTPYMVSMQSLERAWARYKDLSHATESTAGMLDISGEDIQKTLETVHTLTDARTRIEEILGAKQTYRISRVLEIMMSGALAQRASDIHIEPEEGYVRLRYRLDGVLTDVLQFDRETYRLILSRVKLISGLKLNIHNMAQDGRFSVRIAKRDIEVRTSVLPGAYGESIVMRLLDPSTIALPMEELGIEPKLFALLEEQIKRPNGMILNTGPTGSGKTTTLYAFLKRVHNPDIKIITIEDPIEYHLPGIVQTQTSKTYTFAQGLRSTLRQDPDVIMVGEIRDGEVAETAVNAALTGHLVFSTLHTNNAAGTFPRLIDLGVNPRIISSAVNIAMAQRLVRRLKPECKREVKLEGNQKERVERVLDSIVDKSLIPDNTEVVWEPSEGDEACEVSYEGRIAVFEAIAMDKQIEEAVSMSASENEIKEIARSQGLLTMVQDGILKVLQGTTSLSELDRVLDLENVRDGQELKESAAGEKI